MTIFRKNTRLPREYYLGPRTYFVTICSNARRPYLAERPAAERVLYVLQECSARQAFTLHAFCLMPDHLHFLAQGIEPKSDLLELVRVFKLRTAFEFRKSHGLPLWETSYHDHILRSSDSVEDIACYIWWNPVRKGLRPTPQEFPYSGSQTIPWIQRAAGGTSWSAPWKSSRPI